MNKYQFEIEKAGFSDSSLHLLRNRFNYKTIPYKELQRLEVTQGWEVNNWLILMLLGIVLIVFAALSAAALYLDLNDPNVRIIRAEYILMILGPALLGVGTIYAALQRGEQLWVSHGSKRLKLSLKPLRKAEKREEFLQYLLAHPELKSKINVQWKR